MSESYDDFLKKNQEMVDNIKKQTGITPFETHNRFALLYIDRLKLAKTDYKPEKPLSYQECKLMIGTTLLAMAVGEDNTDAAPHLYYCQKLARERGWILKHYDPVDISFARCVAAITIAFHSTIKYTPRPSDIRICLQLGSPTLWKNASPKDMLIGHTDTEMLAEAAKALSFVGAEPPAHIDDVIKLWAGTPFNDEMDNGGVLSISPRIFAQEVQRYIEEHMKFDLSQDARSSLIWHIIEYINGNEP